MKNVIRTYKYAMIRRVFWSVVLVFLCALPFIVWAKETPPKALLEHVTSHKLVHDKLCKVESLKLDGIECYIFFDTKNDVVWVLLFDTNLEITHVLASKDNKEHVVWCRSDVCT